MKVIHISYTHRYDDIRIYEKECKSLKKKGYDVIHIASNKIADMPESIELEVPVKIIKLKKAGRFKVVVEYLKDVKKEVDIIKPEICHLHDWQLLPLIPKLRKNYKVIFDSHEDFPAYLSADFLKIFPQCLKEYCFSGIESYFVKRATWVVAANQYIESQLKKMTKKVTAIKNYPIIFKNDGENYYKPQFCYIGGIGDNLGGEILAKGIRELNAKIFLVGKTNKEYLIKMNLLSQNKVEDLGFCSKKEVRQIVKESRAGLVVYLPHPNCIHALPNKMFEYLEASVPIICSDFPDWKELLEGKECCIFVDPSNKEEVRQAMNYFLEHPEEAKRMGENGRKAIEEEFNWDKEEERLFSLYQGLVNMECKDKGENNECK